MAMTNYGMMSKKAKVWFGILVSIAFLITVASVFLANFMVHFDATELKYSTFIYKDENIKNFFDIFTAQKWQYMNRGGRSVASALLQATVISGELIADIINTVVFVLTGVTVTFLSETMTRIKRSFFERLLCITAVMCMAVALNPNFSTNVLTQQGACNFVYTFLFFILFIWVYMREIPYDCFGSKEPLFGVGLWIIPLGLLAGWSNENLGLVAFIFSLIAIGYVKKVGHNVENWMVSGAVFSFIGSMACMLSPGNIRGAIDTFKEEPKSITYILLERIVSIDYLVLEYLFVAVLILIVSASVCKCFCNVYLGRETVYIIVCAVITVGLTALMPFYPRSETYSTLMLLILAIISIWPKVFEKKPQAAKYVYLGAGVIFIRAMFVIAMQIVGIMGFKI